MQNSIFLVNDEPYCLWDVDLQARNFQFLKGLDADYFDYCLKAHAETDDEQRAVVALRISLHHAIETLFSLIGALVQAPDCAYAWIAKCKTDELRTFVRRIARENSKIHNRLNIESVSWQTISEVVFQTYLPGTERQRETIEKFAGFWERLADDFLEQDSIDEYNSIKHGFRIRRGGFSIAIGVEPAYGVSPPDDQMQPLGHSEFGASFFTIESIRSDKKDRAVRARSRSVNWSLENIMLSFQLAYLSINNVISALKIINGWKTSECKFLRPENGQDFEKPWNYHPGVSSFTIDYNIDETNTLKTTKQDLLTRIEEIRQHRSNQP